MQLAGGELGYSFTEEMSKVPFDPMLPGETPDEYFKRTAPILRSAEPAPTYATSAIDPITGGPAQPIQSAQLPKSKSKWPIIAAVVAVGGLVAYLATH